MQVEAQIVASDVVTTIPKVDIGNSNFGYKPQELLHDRFGHIGQGRLKRTANATVGLEKLFKSSNTNIDFCVACSKAKMHKGAHSPWARYANATRKYQHLNADLIGKFDCPTVGGHYYILTIVDRYSHEILCYMLKTKHAAEIIKCFKQYLLTLKLQMIPHSCPRS